MSIPLHHQNFPLLHRSSFAFVFFHTSLLLNNKNLRQCLINLVLPLYCHVVSQTKCLFQNGFCDGWIKLSNIEFTEDTVLFIFVLFRSKDHQGSFQSSLPYRLINPSKSKLGKISKSVLENINQRLVKLLRVNQWKNSASLINWFKNIEDKKNCIVIKFDVREFFPSMAETILDKTLLFPKQYHNISSDTRLIKHYRKSLLFSSNEAWTEKQTGTLL